MKVEQKTVFDSMRQDSYYDRYTDEELLKTIEVEKTGYVHGKEKTLRSIQRLVDTGNEHNTIYSALLKKDKLDVIAQNIIAKCEDTHKAGRGHTALHILRELDPHVVAALALEAVLSAFSKQRPVQTVILMIAARIETGMIAEIISKEAPQVWRRGRIDVLNAGIERQSTLLKRLAKRIKAGDFQGVDSNMFSGSSEETEAVRLFTREERAHLGWFLLDLIAHSTGICNIVRGKRGANGTTDVIVPSPEILEWIRETTTRLTLLSPEWTPLPIEPKPWTTPFDGGYHTSFLPKYCLIVRAKKNFLEELVETGDMSKVYKAVNAIQSTPWRINRFVFDVAKTLWDSQARLPAFPDYPEDCVVPACPVCGMKIEGKGSEHECFKGNEEALKTWRSGVREARDARVSNTSRHITIAHTLRTAEVWKDEAKLFFPYFLDFRGRIYCRVTHLSPQGTGLAKALLEFADGKPIGTQEAADWLAIHVANSWGKDKLPFSERIQWVKDNQEMLLAVARDPYENRQWATLDLSEAWLALASAFEWAGYVREGLAFVSRIPVGMDGTCSGLQHYAALLRDEGTARQVNVCPGDRPADVYRTVAEKTIEFLKALASEGGEDGTYAAEWLALGILDRKMTKRSVMTLPYGSSLFTCKEYVFERYRELRHATPDKQLGPWVTFSDQHKACCWLGTQIWHAIEAVLSVAPLAMKAMQKTARIMAKAKLPLNWTAPSGFRVQQANVCYDARRVLLATGGDVVYRTVEGSASGPWEDETLPRSMQITFSEPTDEIDVDKQASGVAPNFVHSMDASALVFTVCQLVDDGVVHYSMIHDSFATHACNAALMARRLREAFAAQYSGDPLSDLFHEFVRMLDVIGARKECDEVLEIYRGLPYGTFDVSRVKESLYFFA